MIIVGFTCHTSQKMPHILCRHFKHCAPIIPAPIDAPKPFIMQQFVRKGTVIQIPINMRDMNLLRLCGWVFVYVAATPQAGRGCTCVQFTKSVCGIRHGIVQRPDGLYNLLKKR